MISSGPVLRPASPSTARRLSVPRCYLESPDYSRRCRWSMKPRVLPPLHGAAPRRCHLAVLGTIGHAAANSQDVFSPAPCSARGRCRDLESGLGSSPGSRFQVVSAAIWLTLESPSSSRSDGLSGGAVPRAPEDLLPDEIFELSGPHLRGQIDLRGETAGGRTHAVRLQHPDESTLQAEYGRPLSAYNIQKENTLHLYSA